ncbi:MAG: globin domain-containing protein [Pseudomonadota bacterium]
MKLSPVDITLVRSTRTALAKDSAAIAALFYGKLFAANPAVRPMFPHDMQDQGRKLMATLAVAVDSLENWDRLAPVLAALARRHLGYGVEPFHYAAVSAAFLDTLEDAGVDDATRKAWQRTMSALTGYMIEVAYPEHHLGASLTA